MRLPVFSPRIFRRYCPSHASVAPSQIVSTFSDIIDDDFLNEKAEEEVYETQDLDCRTCVSMCESSPVNADCEQLCGEVCDYES